MQSNWSWVIASYLVTAAAIVGYTLHLRARAREATRHLAGGSE